jgi:hypothetical protein
MIVSTLLIAVAFTGIIGSEFGVTVLNEIPDGYRLLDASTEKGGLLELPLIRWNNRLAVFRMAWQREHGRPIVDGMTSQAPPWFRHAREVFNTFPSDECLWLMRRWRIDSVLISEPFREIETAALSRGDGIQRGVLKDWKLYDIKSKNVAAFATDDLAETFEWKTPKTAPNRQALLTDGATYYTKAVELDADENLEFEINKDKTLNAIKIDYGYGFNARIPSRIEVEGLINGRWEKVVSHKSGRFLRARAADLLLHRKPARLVITVKPVRASRFRLRAERKSWHIPELRVSVDSARRGES